MSTTIRRLAQLIEDLKTLGFDINPHGQDTKISVFYPNYYLGNFSYGITEEVDKDRENLVFACEFTILCSDIYKDAFMDNDGINLLQIFKEEFSEFNVEYRLAEVENGGKLDISLVLLIKKP